MTCPECSSKIRRWRMFAALARQEDRLVPPAETLGRAKGLVEQQVPVSVVTRLKGAMHYEPVCTAPPVGVGAASLPDLVVYHGNDVAVELRFVPEGPHQVLIVGHIL